MYVCSKIGNELYQSNFTAYMALKRNFAGLQSLKDRHLQWPIPFSCHGVVQYTSSDQPGAALFSNKNTVCSFRIYEFLHINDPELQFHPPPPTPLPTLAAEIPSFINSFF